MVSKFIINTSWLLLMIAISALVYVRMAPHNLGLVHVVPPTGATPDAPVIGDGSALFLQVFDSQPKTVWANISTVISNTPRTKQIAGSQDAGMISYVTRSRIFGFPDYTTVLVTEIGGKTHMQMFGRLRFGRSDFGVNGARLRGWVQAIRMLDQG